MEGLETARRAVLFEGHDDPLPQNADESIALHRVIRLHDLIIRDYILLENLYYPETTSHHTY